jgi:hypothetical protein
MGRFIVTILIQFILYINYLASKGFWRVPMLCNLGPMLWCVIWVPCPVAKRPRSTSEVIGWQRAKT